jgi:hypothetical protein
VPHGHGREAAVAIFRDTGSRQAHTRVIAHALPPGRCHRMAHGRRPAKSRHLPERFLHSFQSVEMTEGWQSVEMTGEGSVFCHVDADGDISPHSVERPLHYGRGDKQSAAMQRNCGRTGQPWMSVSTRVSQFRHCAQRTAVGASWARPRSGCGNLPGHGFEVGPHPRHFARSASWQVPSDGSRVLPVRHVECSVRRTGAVRWLAK